MGIFRKAAAGAVLVALAAAGILGGARADTTLHNFIFGAPTAATPGATDYFPLTQGGVIKHLPINGVRGPNRVLNVVDDYGADNTGTVDATTALQTAIDAATSALSEIYFPCGTYLVSTALSFSATNVQYRGAGPCTIIKTTSATNDVFDITGAGILISGFQFITSVTRTAGSFINVHTGGANDITYVLMTGAFIGITIDSTAVTVDKFWIYDTVPTTGVAINVASGYAVHIGYGFISNPSGSQPLAGIRVTTTGDLNIGPYSQILNSGTSLLVTPGNGQVVASLAVTGPVYFDAGGTRGIDLCPTGSGAIVRTKIIGAWASSTPNDGLRICAGVSGVDIVDMHSFLNTGNGINITGGSNINILGGAFAQNSVVGIKVAANVSNFSIIGAQIGAVHGLTTNGGGIDIAGGTSDFYSITGNNFNGQTGTRISDGGSGIHKNIFGNPGDDNDYVSFREGASGWLVFSGRQSTFSGYKFRTNDGTDAFTINNGTLGVNSIGPIADNGTAPTGTAGTGYVRATSPTLVTPVLGAATATTIAVSGATTPTGGVAAAGGFTVSPRNWATCGVAGVSATASFTDQTPVVTEVYAAEIFVPANTTITGIAIRSGSATGSGNVKVGLADVAGNVLKTSVSTAVAGAANVYQRIAFTGGTYAAVGPATYYILTFFDNTATRASAHTQGNCGAGKLTGQTYSTGFVNNASLAPTTFTTALGPVASPY